MPLIVIVLGILALICFLVGTIDIQPPVRKINWVSAGLGLLVLAYLVRA